MIESTATAKLQVFITSLVGWKGSYLKFKTIPVAA